MAASMPPPELPPPEEIAQQVSEPLTKEDVADDVDAFDRIELHESDCDDDSSVEMEQHGGLFSEEMLDEEGNEVE